MRDVETYLVEHGVKSSAESEAASFQTTCRLVAESSQPYDLVEHPSSSVPSFWDLKSLATLSQRPQ